MAIISVNGTSIQAAIDSAQSGDTLSVGAGGYAGFKVTKPLTIIGSGIGATKVHAATGNVIEITPTGTKTTLKGLTSEGTPLANGAPPTHAASVLVRGHDVLIEDVLATRPENYAVRQYAADRLTMRRVEMSEASTGIEIHRGGAGSVAEDVYIHDINRMVLDSAQGYGGDGWAFYASSGPYRLIRPKVRALRARTQLASWGWDGGAFQGYGPCGPVIIEDFEVRDSVNVCETGTDDNLARGVPTGWIFRNGDIYGAPGVVPLTHEKACVGFFLRANNDFLITGNRFHDVDWYGFILVASGFYASEMNRNQIVDNDFWLKRDMPEARYVTVAGGVDMAKFGLIDRNRVHFDPLRTPGKVAGIVNVGNTNDVAQFRSWTPWGDNDTWGPYEVTPPPDPCAAIEAERDEALLKLAVATTQRDTYKSQIDRAKVVLAEENGLVYPSRKVLRSIINRADAVLSE